MARDGIISSPITSEMGPGGDLNAWPLMINQVQGRPFQNSS